MIRAVRGAKRGTHGRVLLTRTVHFDRSPAIEWPSLATIAQGAGVSATGSASWFLAHF